MEYKIIHDSIHGSIKFEGIALELLETPEMQRLSGIKQLGLGYLVFPGANHTRLEHSIGVSYVAGKMGMALGLSSEEITLLKVAGMLHDIGHSPFSHTLEYLLYEKTGMDHMEITAKIIEGKMDIVDGELEEGKRVYEILDDYSIPKNTLERMILGEVERRTDILSIHKNQAYFGDEKNYLVNIISGSLDADQIDYLLRDSHYTGVAHGAIDFPRILNTIKIKNGELMIDKKGVPALEGMLVARALMYSAVYFHKTSRIGELMLSRAVEEMKMDDWNDIYKLNDAELLARLLQEDGYQREIAFRIKYRKLFKKALVVRKDEITPEKEEEIREIFDLRRRRRREREIAEAAGIEPHYVLIDIPQKIADLSEPRLAKTDVKIIDGNEVHPFSRYSPLARALQIRKVQDWILMVATPKMYVEKVRKSARRIFL